MDPKAAIDIAAVTVGIPIWSLITGAFGLITFGIGLGWLGFNVRRSVQSNIEQNNINHSTQMKALDHQNNLLQQIICLTKVQLYAIGNPKFKYKGECD